MDQKFGVGKKPTGTPSLAWSCVVVVTSLLAGASVVHNVYKPGLTLPHINSIDGDKSKQTKTEMKGDIVILQGAFPCSDAWGR